MATNTGSLLDVVQLRKTFGAVTALRSVSLRVRHGEFLAILGPSGCGKTTLLRCIAGLDQADAGSIAIEGVDYTKVSAFKRPLNTVFQSLALFPHMTVFDNIAYGPRRQGDTRSNLRDRVRDAIELVRLNGLEYRYPRQLSGGQQQRVALARAIVNRPKLLLLDEPLSALDLKLKRRMQIELKNLRERLRISFLFVTHDQEDALTMADRIIVMNAGVIEQEGAPDEIYAYPANRFVAEFIGDVNVFPADWLKQHCKCDRENLLNRDQTKTRAIGLVRPENIKVLEKPGDEDYRFEAVVEDVVAANGTSTVFLATPGLPSILIRDMSNRVGPLKKGDQLKAGFYANRVHFISDGAGL